MCLYVPCMSWTGSGCGSWVWTGLWPGGLHQFWPVMGSLLGRVTSGLCSLHHCETTSEGLWSQEHREGLSLLLSPGYESPGLRLRDSSVDPSVHWVGPQDKSHYISSHPFALATNDAVLILPFLMLLWWCLLLLLSRVFSRVLRYRIWFSVELSGAHS